MNNKTSNIYPWVVVGLLWGVALLNYMDRQMLSTMRIPMMEDVRELESAANFGRLMAVFLWVYGLMSPLSGIIGDRVNRKWLIVGSLCVWSGVTYLMAMPPLSINSIGCVGLWELVKHCIYLLLCL